MGGISKEAQFMQAVWAACGSQTRIKPWLLGGGFDIETPSGGRISMNANGQCSKVQAGTEETIMRIYAALGYESVTLEGDNAQFFMAAAVAAQQAGLQPITKKAGFFGKDPPAIPRTSGAHGTAGLATPESLRRAGLTGGTRGRGLRLAEDLNTGEIIRYEGPASILLVGPSRSGKQQRCITTLLAENEEDAFIVFDEKFELLPVTKRARERHGGRVRWLIPFKDGLPEEAASYADNTDSYNPLYGRNPNDENYVIEQDALAALIGPPDTNGESKDTGFFTDNSQSLIAGVNMQLIEQFPERATLSEMASIILTDRVFPFCADAMPDGEHPGSQPVQDRLGSFGAEGASALKGGLGDILRTARKAVKWLSNPAVERIFRTPKTPWRFSEFKHEGGSIFICTASKYSDVATPFTRVVLGCACADLMSGPAGKRRVTCVVDEFASMRMPIFEKIFAAAAGFGFRVLAIVQNAGQLIAGFGQTGYENILSGCEIQLWYPPHEIKTARAISDIAGRRTILTMSHSVGGRPDDPPGVGIGETGQDVLSAHTVMGLPADQMVLVAPGLLPDVALVRRRKFDEYPEITALVDANPWHKQANAGKTDASRNGNNALSPRVAGEIGRWLKKQ